MDIAENFITYPIHVISQNNMYNKNLKKELVELANDVYNFDC